MDVRGLYYEAGKAQATPAVLTVEDGVIMLRAAEDGRFLGDAGRRDAEVSMRLGNIPRQVALPGGWTFETNDNDGIDRLLTAPIDRLLPWLERGWDRVAIAAVIVVLSMVALWRLGIPAATKVAVHFTPYTVEESIGEGTLRSLDAAVFEPSELPEARQQALRDAFSILVRTYFAREDARQAPQFTLLFRKAPAIGANALALPDGTIVVTDDLVALFDDDTPILGILAHEIGHVHHQHTLYQLYRSVGVSAVILFVGGDLSQLAEDAVIQGAALSNLSSSRGMERQADVLGVELSIAAGYDPEALITAVETLGAACENCTQPAWLSTHPGLEDRAELISETIAAQ